MILETLKNKLLTLGIPGLFLISFLDSAGVPLRLRIAPRAFASEHASSVINRCAELPLKLSLRGEQRAPRNSGDGGSTNLGKSHLILT